MNLANNLAKILTEKNITLEYLAKNIDIPYEKLQAMYTGEREFTENVIQKIADFLNMDKEDLKNDGKKEIYKKIGIQLRQIREEKNLTLIELGKMSGVSYTHISEIERGKTCASLKTLEKLAKVLEIPTSFFFQLEENFSLGDKIRRLREKQNLTQLQLAEKVGVSLSLIAQIETGRVKPALDTLYNIAGILGVSVYYFLLTEQEEIEFKQKFKTILTKSWDKMNKMFEDVSEQDFNLIMDLFNILKKYNKLNMEEEKIDPETKELLQIIGQLSKEDKTFLLNNARWLLKKAKG